MRVYIFKLIAISILFFVFCSSAPDYVPKIRYTPGPGPISSEMDKNDKGTGPITSIKPGPFDTSLAKEGDSILNVKCYSCHALQYSKIGPPLGMVLKEHSPEYVMNMIINPLGMEEKDPHVKFLITRYGSLMPYLSLDSAQARAVVEALRK